MKYRIAAAILTIILIMGAGTAEQIIVAETMDEMLSRLDSSIFRMQSRFAPLKRGSDSFRIKQFATLTLLPLPALPFIIT